MKKIKDILIKYVVKFFNWCCSIKNDVFDGVSFLFKYITICALIYGVTFAINLGCGGGVL